MFDVAILGAGPAGLMAALWAAQHGDVALITERLPRMDDPPRIDVVPARFLALLLELGISPRSLGVERLHERRWLAWSTDAARIRNLSPAAHIERPLLDCVLLAHALRHPRIAPFVSSTWARSEQVFFGDGWRAPRLVDATGRSTATATAVTRLPRPWAARTLSTRHRASGRGPGFALAASCDGYAYRIEGGRSVVVGFVGRGSAVDGTPADLESKLRSSGGGWMIDDLPSLSSFVEGRASTASVQWTTPSPSTDARRPLRIGEAALARDPLSSQGIATACSEALLVASIKDDADVNMFELRQAEQRHMHLVGLRQTLESCRFSMEPIWREYADFVSRYVSAPHAGSTAALREGRIVRLQAPEIRSTAS